jgi:hypothetical protein
LEIRYLTFEEKKLVAVNIYNYLKKYGGVWITCDVTPRKFIQKQDEQKIMLEDYKTVTEEIENYPIKVQSTNIMKFDGYKIWR